MSKQAPFGWMMGISLISVVLLSVVMSLLWVSVLQQQTLLNRSLQLMQKRNQVEQSLKQRLLPLEAQWQRGEAFTFKPSGWVYDEAAQLLSGIYIEDGIVIQFRLDLKEPRWILQQWNVRPYIDATYDQDGYPVFGGE